MLFRQTMIAVLATLGTAVCAHAQVLSEATTLVDLVPGDSIELTSPLTFLAGQCLSTSSYYPDLRICAKRFADGEPVKKTFAKGTRLKISKISIVPLKFSWGVLIEFDDPNFKSVEVDANLLVGHTDHRKLTVRDLMDASGNALTAVGRSATGSKAQAGTSAQVSEDSAKKVPAQTTVAQPSNTGSTQKPAQ